MNTNFSKFIRILHRLGFVDDYDRRSTLDGRETQLVREKDGRQVTVQLWSQGHRASHSIRGCSDTIPTSFDDVLGMLRAIETEQTRRDSRYFMSPMDPPSPGVLVRPEDVRRAGG
jgi:hypothetical protein